jgi:hypothetical protein
MRASVGEMATSMGFFQRLLSPVSAEARLLEELSVLAGRNEGLVERLKRHAALCKYPNIKAGVAALAEKEAAHIKTINTILADHSVWAKLPEPALHDGSNNWARLSGDLEVLGELMAELRLAAVKWEPVNQDIAGTLLQLAVEDGERESDLRKLALKCDAMALD